jgi:hypothetical protein
MRTAPPASGSGTYSVTASNAFAVTATERTIARMACLRSADSSGQAVISSASSSYSVATDCQLASPVHSQDTPTSWRLSHKRRATPVTAGVIVLGGGRRVLESPLA